MWHRRRRRRLGVKTKHRKDLLRNLVRGLVVHRRIQTTLARAKETARFADHMVTLAKEGTLAARRKLIRRLGSSAVVKELMDQVAPRLKDRNGGYTRVLKLGLRRGDGAQMAVVQFSVPIEILEKEKKPKKEKKSKSPHVAPEKEEKKPSKEKHEKAIKEEKKSLKAEKEKPEKPPEKEETQKRGSFLSRLRKFLTGE